MNNNYIDVDDDIYRINGTRVSLDSVVYDYLSGLSPEAIVDNFDTLSLEQVYGAITFYLAHRDEVDRHLAKPDEIRFPAQAGSRNEPTLVSKFGRTLVVE